jgi:hypothetical protein
MANENQGNFVCMSTPSLAQLHRAIKISEQIEALKAELSTVLGNGDASEPKTKRAYTKKPGPKGKRKYTRKAAPEGLTEADAVIHPLFGKAKRKYTKKGAATAEAPAPAKKKRTMSPEAREKIAAAQRKRWAKQLKKGKKAAADAPADGVGTAEAPAPAKKKRKKGKMSPEGRAAIVAAQKASWAKVKG